MIKNENEKSIDFINNNFEYYEQEEDGKKYPKINLKNVIFVEAIIKMNSGYLDENKGNPCEKFCDIIKENKNNEINEDIKKGIKDLYYGSIKFWCDELTKASKRESEYLYENIVYFLIKAINRDDSTRLSEDDMEEIKCRIYEEYERANELINGIASFEKGVEIIDKIRRVNTKNDEKEGNKFSFATKFCHYVSYYCFNDDEKCDMYPIFDRVMKDNLPFYINKFVVWDTVSNSLKNKGYNQEELKKSKKADFESKDFDVKKLLDFIHNKGDYVLYSTIIDNIIDNAYKKSKDKDKVSKNGFDHIIWYSLK